MKGSLTIYSVQIFDSPCRDTRRYWDENKLGYRPWSYGSLRNELCHNSFLPSSVALRVHFRKLLTSSSLLRSCESSRLISLLSSTVTASTRSTNLLTSFRSVSCSCLEGSKVCLLSTKMTDILVNVLVLVLCTSVSKRFYFSIHSCHFSYIIE